MGSDMATVAGSFCTAASCELGDVVESRRAKGKSIVVDDSMGGCSRKRKRDVPEESKGKKKRGRPPKCQEVKVLDLSVTVGTGGSDVDISLLSSLDSFLRTECLAGLCAIERGGTLFYLHFQMVCSIASTSIQSVNRLIKRYLGWDTRMPLGGVVMCKTLRNNEMHTFHGMLGYCVKDMWEPHFQMVFHTVNAEEIQKGVDIYAQYGVGELKNHVCLSPQNVFERAFVFFLFFLRRRITTNLPGCLLSMMKRGKYFPSANWVTPFQGKGMEMNRACALWNCLKNPSGTTMRDVWRVFFQDPVELSPPRLDSLIARRNSDASDDSSGLEVSEISANEFRRAIYEQDHVIPVPAPNHGVRIA